jgi:hypothetical protein
MSISIVTFWSWFRGLFVNKQPKEKTAKKLLPAVRVIYQVYPLYVWFKIAAVVTGLIPREWLRVPRAFCNYGPGYHGEGSFYGITNDINSGSDRPKLILSVWMTVSTPGPRKYRWVLAGIIFPDQRIPLLNIKDFETFLPSYQVRVVAVVRKCPKVVVDRF